MVPVITPKPISKFRATLVRMLSLAFQSRMIGKPAHMKSVRMENTPWIIIIASTAFFEIQWPGTCVSQTLFNGIHCNRKAIVSGVCDIIRKAIIPKRK